MTYTVMSLHVFFPPPSSRMLSVSVRLIHISSGAGDQPVRQHMDPQWEERALRPGGKTEPAVGCQGESRGLRVWRWVEGGRGETLSGCRWSATEKSESWAQAARPRWLTDSPEPLLSLGPCVLTVPGPSDPVRTCAVWRASCWHVKRNMWCHVSYRHGEGTLVRSLGASVSNKTN